jgi:hypothetical protein
MPSSRSYTVQSSDGWLEGACYSGSIVCQILLGVYVNQELGFIVWAVRFQLSDLSKLTPLISGRAWSRGRYTGLQSLIPLGS